ncbi:MAG: hypothetical protein OEW70_06885 [candidate division WOR-3 bacterium]|nr:hypothetical protein [candidate division WOR-3 bacterium]
MDVIRDVNRVDGSMNSFSNLPRLIASYTPEEGLSLLEALDREIAFYRNRAGKVFFYGLIVEFLILAGRETIKVPSKWVWMQPTAYTLLFIAVAAVGIALGWEYRNRIHILKDRKMNLLEIIKGEHVYVPKGSQALSEIEVLYVVLVFLSSSGIFLVWFNALVNGGNRSWLFWVLLSVFVAVATAGLAWSIVRMVRIYLKMRRLTRASAGLPASDR